MLRTRDWKIVIGNEGLSLQLFDLENDPLEQTNLCAHPDYREQELACRSELLTRLTANTFRDSDSDPLYCSHTFPSTAPSSD